MRGLVCGAVAQERRILRAIGRHIDDRREQAEQARRCGGSGEPDLRTALRSGAQLLASGAQPAAAAQIAEDEPPADQRCAGEPDGEQDLPTTGGLLRRGGVGHGYRRRLRSGCRCSRAGHRRRDGLHGALRRGLRMRQKIFDAEGCFPDGDRDEQPDEREQPQGILQPRADPAAQQIVERDESCRQNGGRDEPFSHGAVSPPCRAAGHRVRRSQPASAPAAAPWR